MTDVLGNSSFIKQFYKTKRNEEDVWINAYNPVVFKLMKGANMDIQLIYGEKGLAYYLMDYMVKAEPAELKTELYRVMTELEEKGQLTQQARMYRLGFTMLKTRHMCAQEAAYRICHLPMVESSRTVVKLNTTNPTNRFRKLKGKQLINELPDDSTEIFEDNMLILYRDRPESLEQISMFKFASWFEKCSKSVKGSLPCLSEEKSVKKKNRFSCVSTSFVPRTGEDYYYHLLLIHLPHRNESELLGEYESAQEAFLAKEDLLDMTDLTNHRLVDEVLEAAQRLQALNAMKEFEEEESDNDEVDVEMSFQLPESSVGAHILAKDICSPDEFASPSLHEMQETDDAWHNLTVNTTSIPKLDEMIWSLSCDQIRILKYAHKVMFVDCKQMLLYVGGNAGTGKSYLLSLFVQWCRLNTQKFAGCDSVIICAPTGLAAKHINGNTLHSTFKLPIQHGFEQSYRPLKRNSLEQLRSNIGHKKILVVDEVNMVSQHLLKCLNRRLQEIHGNDKLFGGISVLLTGDFLQLRPVRGKPAFVCKEIFDKFDILWLTKNVRQKDDLKWCKVLNNARLGYAKLSSQDVQLLESRCFTSEKLKNCNADMRIYPTQAMVTNYNDSQQASLSNDCEELQSLDLFSQNDFSAGCQIDSNDLPKDHRKAGGLLQILRLSRESRVMLIKNKCEKLVNGSMGNVHSFTKENGVVTEVHVKFDDKESGLSFQNPNRDLAFTVKPVEVEYKFRGRYMCRKQFPLVPAWAVTIHKAEGFSVNSAIVNISECFTAGQAYVGLSRVRTFDGLFIENGPKKEKLTLTKIYADKTAVAEILQFRAQAKVLKESGWLKFYSVQNWL